MKNQLTFAHVTDNEGNNTLDYGCCRLAAGIIALKEGKPVEAEKNLLAAESIIGVAMDTSNSDSASSDTAVSSYDNYVSKNNYLKSVYGYLNNLYARWHKLEKALEYKEKWLNARNEQNKNITHRNAFNDKGIQIANAFLEVMRYKLNELGADSTDAFAKIFDTSHIETEQYYINILLEDLKPIVSDLRNAHMKDSGTASDIDYQSMVKSIIDDFTLQAQITTENNTESSNEAYINGLLLLFCKNLEMKVTQLSAEEKQILKEIFSRSKPAKEHRKLRRRNPKL